MKYNIVLAVCVCLGAVCVRAEDITIRRGSYAAIAYSPSTGKYRYAYDYRSRQAAEDAAKTTLGIDDAKIVCWNSEGFCALALGDDPTAYGVAWRFGAGASNTDAMKDAVKKCNERTSNARVVVCLSSDGQYIHEPKIIKPVQKDPEIINPEPSAVLKPSGKQKPADIPLPKPEPEEAKPKPSPIAIGDEVVVTVLGRKFPGRVTETGEAYDLWYRNLPGAIAAAEKAIALDPANEHALRFLVDACAAAKSPKVEQYRATLKEVQRF